MKFKATILSASFLIGSMLFLTGCTKKVLVEKAKAQPKVEIAPLKPTNQ